VTVGSNETGLRMLPTEKSQHSDLSLVKTSCTRGMNDLETA
jgi:hypothetical protein